MTNDLTTIEEVIKRRYEKGIKIVSDLATEIRELRTKVTALTAERDGMAERLVVQQENILKLHEDMNAADVELKRLRTEPGASHASGKTANEARPQWIEDAGNAILKDSRHQKGKFEWIGRVPIMLHIESCWRAAGCPGAFGATLHVDTPPAPEPIPSGVWWRASLDRSEIHGTAWNKCSEFYDKWYPHRAEFPTQPPEKRCPRCDSPDPKLHPAVQFEGEVHVCPNEFHGPQQPPEPKSLNLAEMSRMLESDYAKDNREAGRLLMEEIERLRESQLAKAGKGDAS